MRRVLLIILFLAAIPASATTPTLKRSYGFEGMTSNSTDAGDDFHIYLDVSPANTAVSANDLLVLWVKIPKANTATISDDQTNSWTDVFTTTCEDTNYKYTAFYTVAAAGTSNVKIHIGANIKDITYALSQYYNTATSSVTDGTSCKNAITPANNTPPNITGNAVTTTIDGDLVVSRVFDQDFPGGDNTVTSGMTPGTSWSFMQESEYFGDMTEYIVQSSHGSITPSATIPQTTHDTFTMMAVAFKSGSGGSAPGAGVGMASSQLAFIASIGTATRTVSFPIAVTGDGVVVCDEAGNVGSNLSSVTDSASSTYTLIVHASQYPICYYAANLTASNSLVITLHFNSASGNDLVGIFDMLGVATSPLDTAATAANSSALTGASSGASAHAISSTATVAFTDAPSIIPGTASGIVIAAGQSGNGPTTAFTGISTYVYATATFSVGGDSNGITNGDMMSIVYHSTNATINIGYTTKNNSSIDTLAASFKAAPITFVPQVGAFVPGP